MSGEHGTRNILESKQSVTRAARQAPLKYAYAVLNGKQPYPDKGTPEAKALARYASYARWGKADPAFLEAFKKYFYRKDEPIEEDQEE